MKLSSTMKSQAMGTIFINSSRVHAGRPLYEPRISRAISAARISNGLTWYLRQPHHALSNHCSNKKQQMGKSHKLPAEQHVQDV